MDFETWWTKEGQYIPPCDLLSEQTRTVYKAFAAKVYAAAMETLEEQVDVAYDNGYTDASEKKV